MPAVLCASIGLTVAQPALLCAQVRMMLKVTAPGGPHLMLHAPGPELDAGTVGFNYFLY